jgi:acyl-CoA thioester hydrolase
MYTSESTIRVRYGETDQMGYCYYGNYAQFYEVGRVEALRNLGFSYRSLEESGIMLPVLEFKIKYLKPAYYDDLLKVKTTVHEIKGARMLFTYEMFNEKNELVNTGETTLVFISKETNRPCAAPGELVERLRG